jgi:glycosyltransferase involved in cell wall biosynthesis
MERRGVRREAVHAVRAAARVVAVSTAVRATIEKWADSSLDIDVIPVGVDADDFPMRIHPPRGNQLLFVGFINYMKGIDVLLAAMALLRERGADAHLTLVGGAFYRDTLKQEHELRALATSLGVSDSVTFLGRRPPGEVSRLMAQCAAVVLPSRAESFGAVLIEALACGTPVVATRCGGPEDIVTPDVGLLVPPEDPAELASAIERVLDNGGAYDPKRLREYALTTFGLPGVAARYAQVYRSALGA